VERLSIDKPSLQTFVLPVAALSVGSANPPSQSTMASGGIHRTFKRHYQRRRHPGKPSQHRKAGSWIILDMSDLRSIIQPLNMSVVQLSFVRTADIMAAAYPDVISWRLPLTIKDVKPLPLTREAHQWRRSLPVGSDFQPRHGGWLRNRDIQLRVIL
jgi:hypothetical protein